MSGAAEKPPVGFDLDHGDGPTAVVVLLTSCKPCVVRTPVKLGDVPVSHV